MNYFFHAVACILQPVLPPTKTIANPGLWEGGGGGAQRGGGGGEAAAEEGKLLPYIKVPIIYITSHFLVGFLWFYLIYQH